MCFNLYTSKLLRIQIRSVYEMASLIVAEYKIGGEAILNSVPIQKVNRMYSCVEGLATGMLTQVLCGIGV